MRDKGEVLDAPDCDVGFQTVERDGVLYKSRGIETLEKRSLKTALRSDIRRTHLSDVHSAFDWLLFGAEGGEPSKQRQQ